MWCRGQYCILPRHSRGFCADYDRIWAVCAAVSTVSSKHILLVNNYRGISHCDLVDTLTNKSPRLSYVRVEGKVWISSLTLPAFLLLLLQLIASAAVIFVRNLNSTSNILDFKPDYHAFSITHHLQQNPRLILLSSCLAIFFPLWIQSTLHFENITSLLMILVCVLPLPRTSLVMLTSI